MTDYPAKSRYRGEVAAEYDRRRAGSPKWNRERHAVAGFLSLLPAKGRVLDVPFGTGRFLDLYAGGGHTVVGIDFSRDMLLQTRASRFAASTVEGLIQGDAEALPLRDGSVDAAVCVRLLNWLPAPVLEKVIAELARVSRHCVILHVRLTEPIDEKGTAPRRKARSRSHGFVHHRAEDLQRILGGRGLAVADSVAIDAELDPEGGVQHTLRVHRLTRRGDGTA